MNVSSGHLLHAVANKTEPVHEIKSSSATEISNAKLNQKTVLQNSILKCDDGWWFDERTHLSINVCAHMGNRVAKSELFAKSSEPHNKLFVRQRKCMNESLTSGCRERYVK
jgi:hypothetical protein